MYYYDLDVEESFVRRWHGPDELPTWNEESAALTFGREVEENELGWKSICHMVPQME